MGHKDSYIPTEATLQVQESVAQVSWEESQHQSM